MTTNVPSVEFSSRDFKVNPRKLRREGRIPATIYAKGKESISIDVDKKTFTHMFYSKNPHLVLLSSGKDQCRALLKKVQTDTLTNEVLNIEFLQVKEDELVTLTIELVVEGEAPAVKLGASMLVLLDHVEIECLPKDIPNKLVYDVSTIEGTDVSVTIGDLNYPQGVKPTMAKDVPVIRIAVPKEETEAAEEATEEAAKA